MSNFVLPHQHIFTLSAGLGKPSGDLRTIAKTAMWSRGLCRSDSTVACWEVEHIAHFDTAGKGKSALVALSVRNLKAEVGNVLNFIVVGAFNDIEKFFDSVNLDSLCSSAIEHNFPKSMLVFALAQHTAPRVIQLGAFCGEPIPISSSIIAGCKFSLALTRCFLKSEYTHVADDNPDVELHTYVDDSPITAHLESPLHAVAAIVSAMTSFKASTRRLKLSLSPKAGVVSNKFAVAHTISKRLAAKGIIMRAFKSYRDTGASYCGGSSKCKDISNKRFINSASRRQRAARLAPTFRGARRLFAGSCFSASTWGHQVAGFSKSRLLQLEQAAARTSGIRANGRCRFFTVCVVYGPRNHPIARILRELFVVWFQVLSEILRSSPEWYIRIRRAWTLIRDRLSSSLHKRSLRPPTTTPSLINFKADFSDSQVCGIMSNVISTLFSLDWTPSHVDFWVSPSGDVFRLTSPSDNPTPLINELVDSYNTLQFPRAALHFEGGGLQGGVDWCSTLQFLRALRRNKSGKTPKTPRWPSAFAASRAAALETILVGASWPQARVSSAYPSVSPVCHLCGIEDADSSHCNYNCDYINSIDSSDIQDTNHLIPIANQQSADLPCLWFRGILPIALTSVPAESLALFPFLTEFSFHYDLQAPSCGLWPSGDYFGDGSGGRYAAFPTLRRCGVGLAHLAEGSYRYGLYCSLIGTIQTVPRSEVAAALVLLYHVAPGTVINFFSDNKVFVDAFNKGHSYCKGILNSDFYQEIFSLIQSKSVSFSVLWLPSHLDDDPNKERATPVPSWVTKTHINGNGHADRLAKTACRYFDLPSDVAKPILEQLQLAKQIQLRLAAVVCHLPHRTHNKHSKPLTLPLLTINDSILQSRHWFSNPLASVLECTICLSRHSRASPALKGFLASECLPVTTTPTWQRTPTHI